MEDRKKKYSSVNCQSYARAIGSPHPAPHRNIITMYGVLA